MDNIKMDYVSYVHLRDRVSLCDPTTPRGILFTGNESK